jgi:hypothetical protein
MSLLTCWSVESNSQAVENSKKAAVFRGNLKLASTEEGGVRELHTCSLTIGQVAAVYLSLTSERGFRCLRSVDGRAPAAREVPWHTADG